MDEDLILDSSLSFRDIKIGRGIVRIHPDRVEFIRSRFMNHLPLYERERIILIVLFFTFIAIIAFSEERMEASLIIGSYILYNIVRLVMWRNVTYVASIPRSAITHVYAGSVQDQSLFIHYLNDQGNVRRRQVRIVSWFSATDKMKSILYAFREEGFEVSVKQAK